MYSEVTIDETTVPELDGAARDVKVENMEYGEIQCPHCYIQMEDYNGKYARHGYRDGVTECMSRPNPDYDADAEDGPTSIEYFDHEAVPSNLSWFHTAKIMVDERDNSVTLLIKTSDSGEPFVMTLRHFSENDDNPTVAGKRVLFAPPGTLNPNTRESLIPHGHAFIIP